MKTINLETWEIIIINYFWKSVGILSFSFYVTYLIFWSLVGIIQQHSTVIIVPLGVLIVLFAIDLCIQIKNELIEYVFMTILIFQGLYITYESLFYQEYQFHEIWLIFYCIFLLISISCCFHWKRMIALYWFVQIWNFIMLHSTYKTISVYFYPGFILITSLYPLVCMVIARLILAFLMMIHNNQELIKIIKKILLIFPEAILIQTVDKNTGKLVVQLVNDTAAKEIIKYQSPCGQPIDDNRLEFNFKIINNNKSINKNIDQDQQDLTTTLSNLLENHVEKIQGNRTETMSSIELWTDKCEEESENTRVYYNVKTVKLKWGTNKYSYIHVFVNTTAVKQIEVEKTKNDWLQLMFSSISHEFRTPLNAFSNSVLLLESNYEQLLHKIDRLVPKVLVDKLISPNQRESNGRFYTICKISTASLMSLVEDILDLAKLEAGTFSLNEQPFKVSTLVHDIESIFMFQWMQKGLVFRIEIEKDLSESSFCSDIGRIKQILMNLISNSFKFTQVGSMSIKIF